MKNKLIELSVPDLLKKLRKENMLKKMKTIEKFGNPIIDIDKCEFVEISKPTMRKLKAMARKQKIHHQVLINQILKKAI